MLLSLASSGVEWRDDHDALSASVRWKGGLTPATKRCAVIALRREWEWESEISVITVYCRWMRCAPAELAAWGGPHRHHRSQSEYREPKSGLDKVGDLGDTS